MPVAFSSTPSNYATQDVLTSLVLNRVTNQGYQLGFHEKFVLHKRLLIKAL